MEAAIGKINKTADSKNQQNRDARVHIREPGQRPMDRSGRAWHQVFACWAAEMALPAAAFNDTASDRVALLRSLCALALCSPECAAASRPSRLELCAAATRATFRKVGSKSSRPTKKSGLSVHGNGSRVSVDQASAAFDWFEEWSFQHERQQSLREKGLLATARHWDVTFADAVNHVDWIASYPALRPVLLANSIPPNCSRILVPGCGVSTLGCELQGDVPSLLEVVHTDISHVACDYMTARFESADTKTARNGTKLSWQVGDITQMPEFADASFHAVIDKGVLDTLMFRNAKLLEDELVSSAMREVHRVLAPGGVFTVISPRKRLPFYKNHRDSGTPTLDLVPSLPIAIARSLPCWKSVNRSQAGEATATVHLANRKHLTYVWTFVKPENENASGS